LVAEYEANVDVDAATATATATATAAADDVTNVINKQGDSIFKYQRYIIVQINTSTKAENDETDEEISIDTHKSFRTTLTTKLITRLI